MISSRSSRRTRALGMLVLAATFAAGAMAATAVDQVLHADPATGGSAADGKECDQKRGHLLDQLDLTTEQRSRIDSILERRRKQTDRFWSDAGPTLDAIMDSTRAEIRAVLTPDQRARYEQLRQARKAADAARRAADAEPGSNR